MATAVCGNVTRAASDEFSGSAKIKQVAGTVAATGTPVAQERPRFTNHQSLLTMLTSRLSPGYRSRAGDLNRGLRKRR